MEPQPADKAPGFLYPRRAWTTTPLPDGLTPFDGGRLQGVAVHYTGSSRPLGDQPTIEASARLIEAERRLHTAPKPAGRGWRDIAYNYAIDTRGRVFDLRGAAYRSAANGDQHVNATHAAVTFLLGVGNVPTPAMVAAFTAWRTQVWLRRWPRATRVVGHRDLHSTACPGAPTYRLIQTGALTAPADEGTSMPTDQRLHPDDIEAIARRAAELTTGIRALHPVLVDEGAGAAELLDGRDIDALPSVVGETQHDVRTVLASLARIEAHLGTRP